eukprot:COSAG01_NODE_4740_length_4777_cov_23.046815_5_plen_205_part_00
MAAAVRLDSRHASLGQLEGSGESDLAEFVQLLRMPWRRPMLHQTMYSMRPLAHKPHTRPITRGFTVVNSHVMSTEPPTGATHAHVAPPAPKFLMAAAPALPSLALDLELVQQVVGAVGTLCQRAEIRNQQRVIVVCVKIGRIRDLRIRTQSARAHTEKAVQLLRLLLEERGGVLVASHGQAAAQAGHFAQYGLVGDDFAARHIP